MWIVWGRGTCYLDWVRPAQPRGFFLVGWSQWIRADGWFWAVETWVWSKGPPPRLVGEGEREPAGGMDKIGWGRNRDRIGAVRIRIHRSKVTLHRLLSPHQCSLARVIHSVGLRYWLLFFHHTQTEEIDYRERRGGCLRIGSTRQRRRRRRRRWACLDRNSTWSRSVPRT